MSKGRILLCNVFPQAPAAAGTYLCITVRCVVLVTVNCTLSAASVCDEDKIIFCEQNAFFHAVYLTFNCGSDLFAIAEFKDNVGNFRIELEVNACGLKVALHRKDQGLILVVFGEFQGAEIRKSGNMMNETLEVQLHLQCAVPVLECKHRSPVQPERGVEDFVIKYILDRLVVKILILCHEQLHDLHAALLT